MRLQVWLKRALLLTDPDIKQLQIEVDKRLTESTRVRTEARTARQRLLHELAKTEEILRGKHIDA